MNNKSREIALIANSDVSNFEPARKVIKNNFHESNYREW